MLYVGIGWVRLTILPCTTVLCSAEPVAGIVLVAEVRVLRLLADWKTGGVRLTV